MVFIYLYFERFIYCGIQIKDFILNFLTCATQCFEEKCRIKFCVFRILTEKKITSEEDVWDVCEWFHSKGVRFVVLSSTDLGSEEELLGMASSFDDR